MDLDQFITNMTEQISNKFEEDFTNVANKVNELYFNEANKIYDSFIKQFYSYPTEVYIRHWESSPGTRKGSNLYYGNQNKIHRGKDPYFEIKYDGSKMADYKHDSADDVINQIAAGANIIIGSKGGLVWMRSWRGEYNSRYFHYKGTLQGAYDTFLSNYEDMMTPVFMRRWKKAGW